MITWDYARSSTWQQHLNFGNIGASQNDGKYDRSIDWTQLAGRRLWLMWGLSGLRTTLDRGLAEYGRAGWELTTAAPWRTEGPRGSGENSYVVHDLMLLFRRRGV